jgi:hypothetical protein
MQFFKHASCLSLFALFAVSISGCSSISPEQQKNYAQLTPKGTWGVVGIDGKLVMSLLAGTAEDVLPGQHNIDLSRCEGINVGCVHRFYNIDTQAGLSYVLDGTNNVEVYDRFDHSKHVDTLHISVR